MNYLAKNLRWLRNRTEYTQATLAYCIEAKRSNYESMEAGRTLPQTKHLRRLSLLYEVSIDYLVRKDLSKLSPVDVWENFILIQEQLAEIDVLNAKAA